MFAIPIMEISAPAAEQALDATLAAFTVLYEEALPRVYGYSSTAAVAPSRCRKTSPRRRSLPRSRS